jgi:hypothetical protein
VSGLRPGIVNKADLPRWDHQKEEFEKHGDSRSRMLLWPMRSGKSRGCIDPACRQFRARKIDGVIVIAPNGVHLNWALNEINTWAAKDINHTAFAWETTKQHHADKKRQWQEFLRHPGMKWFCVNMEALMRADATKAINDFQRACRGKRFMLIVSEVHHFGRPGSHRTHRARSLAFHASFVRIETGTAILTGMDRAFSQFELLAPGALGFRTLKGFKKQYVVEEPCGPPGTREFLRMRVKGYINEDDFKAKIAPWTSLVLREDLNLPEPVSVERPLVMSDKQRAAYLELVSTYMIESEDISAAEGGARMIKLQQILGGFIMDTKLKRIVTIDADAPIYDAVLEQIVGTAPGNVLVWFRFKEECRRMKAKLIAAKMPVLEYWGDYTQVQREANRARYLKNPDKGITMLGTADCGGEGLDFSTARLMVAGSGNPNARMMEQAKWRASVIGGKAIDYVMMRHYGTVCDRIYAIVQGRVTLADTLTGHGLREVLLATDV